MNTKGIKFLAVLAILAMAFSAIAVVSDDVIAEGETGTEPTEKVLKSIAVTTNPTKLEYTAGEVFDKTGMVVTATYTDQSTADVTTDIVIEDKKLTIEKSVTVSYTLGTVTATASVAITVNPALVDFAKISEKISVIEFDYAEGKEYDVKISTNEEILAIENVRDGVVITDPKGINSGYYSAKFELNPGYVWNEGDGKTSTAQKSITAMRIVLGDNFYVKIDGEYIKEETTGTTDSETEPKNKAFASITTAMKEAADKEGTKKVIEFQTSYTLSDDLNAGDIILDLHKTKTAMTVPAGVKFDGTVSYGESNYVKVENVAAGTKALVFTAGSVEISGIMSIADLNAAISEASGTVVFKNLTIVGENSTDSKLTISKPVTVMGTLTLTAVNLSLATENLTVNSDAVVVVDSNAKLSTDGNAKIVNNGIVKISKGADLPENVEIFSADGTGSVTNTSDVYPLVDQKVSLTAIESQVYRSYQRVVVDGDWTIGNGDHPTIVVIEGELYVPEGSTLTVYGNSLLVLTYGAKLVMDGTLIVNEIVEGFDRDTAWTLEIPYITEDTKKELDNARYPGIFSQFGEVLISGTASVSGAINLYSHQPQIMGKVSVLSGGDLTIESEGSLSVSKYAEVLVEALAVATIEGTFDASNFLNYGLIVIDSDKPITEDVKISLLSDSAIVNIKEAVFDDADKTITITDEGLVFYTYKDDNKEIAYVKVGDEKFPINTIEISSTTTFAGKHVQDSVTGIMVTEKVTSKSATEGDIGYSPKAKKIFTNTMDLSGAATASQNLKEDAPETEQAGNPAIKMTVTALRGAAVEALDELDLGANITLANQVGSYITVAGMLDLNHKTTSGTDATLSNGGIIIMSGDGLMDLTKEQRINSPAEIRGAMIKYETFVEYSTLDTAIAKGNANTTVKTITVVGTSSVNKTATVREGLEISRAADFTIGPEDNSVVLTMANGSALKGNGNIYVDGTLYAENKSNVNDKNIYSDVYTEQIGSDGKPVSNGWAKWTNLITALNEAQAGSKVTIRTTDYVYLKSSTEIRDGVTLFIPSTCAGLVLANGVTLTVTGTLQNESDIFAQTMFDTTAKNVTDDRSSAIVVNGLMMNEVQSYGYSKQDPQTDYEHIKSMRDGAPIAGAYYTMQNKECISPLGYATSAVLLIQSDITVKGEVDAGSVTFIPTDDCQQVIVFAGITDKKTSLKADLVLVGSKLFIEPKVNNEFNGSVTVDDSKVTFSGLTATGTIADGVTITDSEDMLQIAGNGAIGKSAKVDEGIVYAGDLTLTGKAVTVASGATLMADASSAIANITVDGYLVVPNGKAMTVNGKLIVNANGSVIVSESTSTDSQGTLNIKELYVGISDSAYEKHATSAAASVSGPIAIDAAGKAVVLDGSTIDSTAQAVLDKIKKTEFYVNDKLWITVYAAGNDPLTDTVDGKFTYYYAPSDLQNCIFDAWATKAGDKSTKITTAVNVGATGYTKVYALIDYDIYSVKIVTDSGIKAVSIDNIQMLRSPAEVSGTNTFTTLHNIEAGSHKVTYTLQDGYEGTATLYTEYGTILQNLSFTVSGTDADDRDLTLQLYGTEKEVPAPTPEPEKESEWTITTILLLILVILIAIMAVIVAMRLMRS